MSQVKLFIGHYLTEADARGRIKCLLGELAGLFAEDVTHSHLNWSGNVADFNLAIRGVSAAGRMTIFPREVDISGECSSDDPDLIRQVETVISERCRQLLV